MSLVTQLTQKPVLRIKNIPKIDVFPVFSPSLEAPLVLLVKKTKLQNDISQKLEGVTTSYFKPHTFQVTSNRLSQKYFFEFRPMKIDVRYFGDPHGAHVSDLATKEYTTSKMSP